MFPTTGTNHPTDPTSSTAETTPGTGLYVTGDGAPVPIEMRHLPDDTAALISRNILIGGELGAGKSSFVDNFVAHAALSTVAKTLDQHQESR